MKLEHPKNVNYAATIVSVNTIVDLPGLDNLVGVPVLGCTALTTRGVKHGGLRVAFTAETQLSEEYAAWNNLNRDAELNKDPNERGYLDKNRRIRAIKMRGHVSSALLMPLSSLSFTGIDTKTLTVGDTFDTLNGYAICNKYEIPVKRGSTPARTKVEKAFKRVTTKVFPEHLDTDQYGRSKHLLNRENDCIVTQKLHGTSWRGGHVPVLRELRWRDKIAKWFGVAVPEYDHDVVFGSRKVIKDPNNPRQDHYYENDIWTEYGKNIAELIPEGFLVYGELVGWTGDGTPLQKNYTYSLPQGEAELFVYRVASINRNGVMADLSWDGVKEFCSARGLKWVPELTRVTVGGLEDMVSGLLDIKLTDVDHSLFTDAPLSLSHDKTVDEGVCIRQEGLTPLILKAKSPIFLEHETKLLDRGEADMESIA